MNIRQTLWVAIWAVGIAGCAKGPAEDSLPAPGKHADAAANRWIHSQMKDQYLYNDHIARLRITTQSYEQSCESFFLSLLSSSPDDNDGKHTEGRDYFYSTMERGNTSKAASFGGDSYGIEFKLYTYPDNESYGAARVMYVVEGSPADRAGIRRGDWIRQVNGRDISFGSTNVLVRGGQARMLVQRIAYSVPGLVYDVTWEKEVVVDAAEPVAYNPVLTDTVIVRGTHRIGYLAYTSFDTGPQGPSAGDHAYDEALKAVFAEFARNRIDELVLDLRYTPGGYISCCQLLSSLIAGESRLGESFCYYRYNTGQETELKFLGRNEVGGATVDLQRLYVLTGPWTASASELLISALKPYMPLRLIGTRTEGKNVGSYEIRSDTYALTLHPITLQLLNKEHWTDYAAGFMPDIYLNDDANQDQMRELGDPEEYLLSQALAEIVGSESAASKAVAGSSAGPFGPVADAPSHLNRVQGAIAGNEAQN